MIRLHPTTGLAAIGYGKRGPIWPVMGGSQPIPTPPAPAPTPPVPGPGPAPSGDQLTVTQDWLNRKLADEKHQGKDAALRNVATELGMTVEEAKAFIQAKKDEDTKNLTEAQRVAKEATDAQTAASKALSEAQALSLNARVQIALVGAAASTATLKDAAVLVTARGITSQSDEAAITAAVEKLKTDVPALFGEAPAPTIPGSHASPPARSKTPGGPFGAEGLAEFKRRYPDPVSS